MNKQQILTKSAPGNDSGAEDNPVIKAMGEHAERFEKSVGDVRKNQTETNERLSGLEQEVAALKDYGTGSGSGMPHKSALAGFLESDQLSAMREGANSTGRVQLKGASVKLLVKALTNDGQGQAGDDGVALQAQRWVGLGENPQPVPSLVEALPSLAVSGPAFEYMVLNGYANAAATQVLEGDTKAEATVPTDVLSANIATVAHWVRASNQVLADGPALENQLNRLLRYGVVAKLEDQLINGPGGTGKIAGLLSLGTAATTTATDPADRIGEAITELRTTGWQPSHIVLNPSDWFAIQSVRGNSEGGYLLGSPRDPAPPSLWSVPVILSAALAAGTAIVMDARQVALLDRQQPVVMASREDGSNFTENLTTILAELRAGLAVFSPSAVLSVDLTPST